MDRGKVGQLAEMFERGHMARNSSGSVSNGDTEREELIAQGLLKQIEDQKKRMGSSAPSPPPVPPKPARSRLRRDLDEHQSATDQNETVEPVEQPFEDVVGTDQNQTLPLESRVQQLEVQLQQHKSEVERLVVQNEEWKLKVYALEEERNDLRRKQRLALASSNDQYQELQEQIQDRNKQLAEVRKSEETLREQLELTRRRVTELEEELSSTRRQARLQFEESQARRLDLEQQLQELQTRRASPNAEATAYAPQNVNRASRQHVEPEPETGHHHLQIIVRRDERDERLIQQQGLENFELARHNRRLEQALAESNRGRIYAESELYEAQQRRSDTRGRRSSKGGMALVRPKNRAG